MATNWSLIDELAGGAGGGDYAPQCTSNPVLCKCLAVVTCLCHLRPLTWRESLGRERPHPEQVMTSLSGGRRASVDVLHLL